MGKGYHINVVLLNDAELAILEHVVDNYMGMAIEPKYVSAIRGACEQLGTARAIGKNNAVMYQMGNRGGIQIWEVKREV